TEALACLAEMDVRALSTLHSKFNAWHIEYSPDGQTLAVASNQKVFLQDLWTNQELPSIPKSRALTSFAFHPSGPLAVSTAPGRVSFVPLKPKQPSFPEIVGEGHVFNIQFSRSGDRVAVVWGEVRRDDGFPSRVREAIVYETASGKSLWKTD